MLLLGGEIKISRKFKQEIVQPILKVKLNFDHKNLRGLFLGGDGLCCVGQTTDGKLKHFSNVFLTPILHGGSFILRLAIAALDWCWRSLLGY